MLLSNRSNPFPHLMSLHTQVLIQTKGRSFYENLTYPKLPPAVGNVNLRVSPADKQSFCCFLLPKPVLELLELLSSCFLNSNIR